MRFQLVFIYLSYLFIYLFFIIIFCLFLFYSSFSANFIRYVNIT